MDKRERRKLFLIAVSFLLVGGLLASSLVGGASALGPVKGWPTPEEELGVEILFEADPEEIEPSQCTTLRWEVRPGDAVQKVLGYEAGEPGEGVELENAGEVEACPDKTTTYILKVHTARGLIERSVTIHVAGAPGERPLEKMPEMEIFFEADRKEMESGGCATLTWAVAGPEGAIEGVYLYKVIAEGIERRPVPREGREEVCLEATGVFILLVDVPGELIDRTLTIRVHRPPEERPPEEGRPPEEERPPEERPPGEERPPEERPGIELMEFWAEPDSITTGQCTTLRWEVVGPEEMMVFLNGTPVNRVGPREECPGATTTYVLVAESPAGPMEKSVTVHVAEAPPSPGPPPPQPPPSPQPPGCALSLDFRADRTTINVGEQATLIWTMTCPPCTLCAQHAYLDGVEVPGNGSKVVAPTATTTYTLHVVKLDGSSEDRSLTIIVIGLLEPVPMPTIPTADLVPTDIYPDKRPQGKVWARITNNGPDTLTNVEVKIWAEVKRSDGTPFLAVLPSYKLTLAPGQTQAINMGLDIDNSQWGYDITVEVESTGFYYDSNTGNNRYSESIPPPPQLLPVPPGLGP